MKLIVLLFFIGCGTQGEEMPISRIQKCSPHCSQQEARCRTQLHFPSYSCIAPPADLNSTSIHGGNISTLMECERRQQCSLQIKVLATVPINEHIEGVSMCFTSPEAIKSCSALSFPKTARKRLAGKQVTVQSHCLAVRPDQNVRVTLTTIPTYCNLSWSEDYKVPGCKNELLRENVPECIIGRIDYTVDTEKRQLSIRASGMLEDKDYHLRLCYKGLYTCRSTKAYKLIKKGNPSKNTTFQYSQPLPCLCIEGWSSMTDAPRVRVCPFRNYTEELWSGVLFNPVAETLSWEPKCPVDVAVTLCQLETEGVCTDISNSTHIVSMQKVEYSKVDPHPRLCMKFTTETGSWIKCVFSESSFVAWDISFSMAWSHLKATITTPIRANLSLSICQESHPMVCSEVAYISTEPQKPVTVNLTKAVCDPDVCIQVRRTDVAYSVPVLQCRSQCEAIGHLNANNSCESLCTMLIGVAVTVVFLAFIVGNIGFRVLKRRHEESNWIKGYPQEQSTCLIKQLPISSSAILAAATSPGTLTSKNI